MQAGECVLVVDDDAVVRELLRDYLGGHGYAVLEADGGESMRAVVAARVPDVVLLDIGLPGEDGLSLARFLRERFDLPILIVSGAGETVDRVVGLEVGADDYLTKPFDLRELRARLKSVLRRYRRPAAQPSGEAATAPAPAARIAVGSCRLDLQSRRLFAADGAEVPLTSMEFELLKVFIERPNRPLTRDQLLNLTQNRDWDPYDRSIDIRIARLRRKIETDPEKPLAIRTVRSVGYMFVPGQQ
jgi:DNA-binding response OmpR family regulator